MSAFEAPLSGVFGSPISALDDFSLGLCLRALCSVCFDESPYDYHNILLTIMLVSRYWFSIVVSDSVLWSTFHVGDRTPYTALKLWLRRSKAVPLTIHVAFGSTSISTEWDPADVVDLLPASRLTKWTAFFSALKPHFPRCVELFLCTMEEPSTHILMSFFDDVHLPSLFALHLDMVPHAVDVQRSRPDICPYFVPAAIPCLRRLDLCSMFVLWHDMDIYNNITSLRLDGVRGAMAPTPAELFDVLRHAPLLTHLYLSGTELDVSGNGFWGLDPADLPLLTSLSHLYLAISTTQSAALLSYLNTPRLQAIHLQFDDDDLVHTFVNCCSVQLEQITSFILDADLRSVTALVALLNHLPNVRIFDARPCTPFSTLAFYAAILRFHPPCTFMEKLLLTSFIEFTLIHDILSVAAMHGFGRNLSVIAPAIGFNNTTLDTTTIYVHSLDSDRLTVKSRIFAVLFDAFA